MLVMKTIIVVIFSLIGVVCGQNASVKIDLLSVNGRDYESATVTAETRLLAKIVYSSGITRVPAAHLPVDIQKQLGLIPNLKNVPLISDVSMRKVPQGSLRFNEMFGAWTLKSIVCSSKITVLQDLGVMALCALGSSDETVALIGDSEDRADGSVFDAPIEDTGRLFEYTSVLGAPKKVKIFKVVVPKTEAEFVGALRNGAKFLIPDSSATIICDTCKGYPIKCAKCGSSGTVKVERQIRLKW